MRATTGLSPSANQDTQGRRTVFALLLMAGKSQRFGRDKLFLDFAGKPLWRYSYDLLASSPSISGIGLVVSPERIDEVSSAVSADFVIAGGDSRYQSGRAGLERVPVEYEFVLVHDAARPFLDQAVLAHTVETALADGASFASVLCTDTIHQVGEAGLTLLDRSALVAAQTPQVAYRTWLLEAYRQAGDDATDEVSMLVSAGFPVTPAMGSLANIKVTHENDLSRLPRETRTGFGYDIHSFSSDPGRPLWLGGVEFDERPGLEGHSDADPVLHAIVDAILGAACLGDIGVHFPPGDPQWKDCRSARFLEAAVALVGAEGWRVSHLDATVVAETPKVMPRRQEVVRAIAEAASLDPSQVSVKATTAEGLGDIGSGKGIAAYAVATLTRVAVV